MSLTGEPTPRQILEGIRSSLRNEVLPALQGEQAAVARNRLTMALTMLTWVGERWDSGAFLLVEEAESLQRLLEESVEPLAAAGYGDLARSLGALAASIRGSLLLSDLRARSDALQGGLFELARIVTADSCPSSLAQLGERVFAELSALTRRGTT